MSDYSDETIRLLFARAGVTPSATDLEQMRIFFERLRRMPAPDAHTEPWLVAASREWPNER